MSNNSSSGSNSNRNGFIFPDFSLRRLLLQTRAGRAPYTARMCDVERGASNSNGGATTTSTASATAAATTPNGIANSANSKHEKTGHGLGVNSAGDVSSNKVSFTILCKFNIFNRLCLSEAERFIKHREKKNIMKQLRDSLSFIQTATCESCHSHWTVNRSYYFFQRYYWLFFCSFRQTRQFIYGHIEKRNCPNEIVQMKLHVDRMPTTTLYSLQKPMMFCMCLCDVKDK